ncbi:hypothetical protein CRG98_041726 [Punica granatum]|uniref:Uncharacterized protein n=1 Tax=Punica granatum TaxID=22663 RepID=A0A2I0I1M3_PUNGR|nr:hypothetical protein CRG98_041726 [Punica granatum]
MNLRCRKVRSHGLADRARLQGARARWLGELAVQESKLARVSRPDNVARGRSEVARRTCGSRKVNSHGLADPARLQEARGRWLGKLAAQESCKRHERGCSANLRCKKVNSNGLADPARLQEARAGLLGELAVQEIKLARVSRPGKVARSTSEVARRTCEAEKKGSSHGLENLARLQEARARWLYKLAVQESKLVRVSRPGKVEKARARWLVELAGQESNLSRVCRSGMVAKGMSVVARRTCGVGKKVRSHGLADRARLQGARAWWLNELAVQESKLARVSGPGKVARGTSEVARRTCGARNETRSG